MPIIHNHYLFSFLFDPFRKPLKYIQLIIGGTTPKTNMSPENQWLEDVFPISSFLGDMLVFRDVPVVQDIYCLQKSTS